MAEALVTIDASHEIMREMRVMGLLFPYYFEKEILGNRKMVDHLHGRELERFVENLVAGWRKQWIEWPRGHYKTTCFTIGLGIWMVLPWNEDDVRFAVDVLALEEDWVRKRMSLHNRDYVQLLAFENAGNAARKIFEIRRTFETNQLFRACYEEIKWLGTEKPWNNEALRIRRTMDGERVGESTFQSIGVDGALQSQHYDIVWEDDLVGKDAIESPTIMASTIRWHGLLNGTRPGPNLGARAWRFGVSNRWGFSDLNSHVRSNEKDFLFHTRKIYEDDKPIFPEEFTVDLIENEIKPSMTPYDFSCQFNNSPIPPGESDISKDLVHKWTFENVQERVDDEGNIVGLKDADMVCSCGLVTKASHLRRYMHLDPYNAKGKFSTSAPGLVVTGLLTSQKYGNHVFLLKYFVGRESGEKIVEKITEFNDKYWPEIFTYEDVGAQNQVEVTLRILQRSPEWKAQHRIFRRILPAGTKGKPKEVRIPDSLFNSFLRMKYSARPDHHTFWQMLETWPHEVPGHDYDLLDAMAQGPQFYQFPKSEDDSKAEERAEKAYLAEFGKPYSHQALTIN